MIAELLDGPALHRLRSAQAILNLAGTYSDARLEAACRKATAAGDPSYRTIRNILAARLEDVEHDWPTGDAGASAFLHGAAGLFADVIPFPAPAASAAGRGPPRRACPGPTVVTTPVTTSRKTPCHDPRPAHPRHADEGRDEPMTILRPALADSLRTLKLSGMLETLDARLAQAQVGDLGYLEFLQILCDDEITRREQVAMGRRLRRARFDIETTLEGFDFGANAKLPAA